MDYSAHVLQFFQNIPSNKAGMNASAMALNLRQQLAAHEVEISF
jgi:hypothetical protein